MRNTEGIVFDLDGTLLNTVEDIMDSCNAGLAAFGCPPHGIDEYRYFIGDGIEELVRRALPEERRDDGTVSSCLALVRKEYKNRWHDKSVPYEGAAEMLEEIVSMGLRTAVFSNKPHDFTLDTAAHYFPLVRFDVMLGAKDGNPRKPDPWGALHIAKELGIPPSRFAYLGDTSTDMLTAKAAGMFAIGAEWGFRGKEELVRAGADVVAYKPSDVVEILKGR